MTGSLLNTYEALGPVPVPPKTQEQNSSLEWPRGPAGLGDSSFLYMQVFEKLGIEWHPRGNWAAGAGWRMD